MSIENPDQAYELLRDGAAIDDDASFELAKLCSMMLRQAENEAKGRDLVIRTLDASKRLPREALTLWNDVVEAAGLYPYVDHKRLTGTDSRVRYEFHRAAHLPSIYFHTEQALLASELRSGRSV